MQTQGVSFSIGDISRETGLSVSTLRYYEKLGLLAPVPRSAGNIRQYGEADLSAFAADAPACPTNPADCPMLRADAPAGAGGKSRPSCVPPRRML